MVNGINDFQFKKKKIRTPLQRQPMRSRGNRPELKRFRTKLYAFFPKFEKNWKKHQEVHHQKGMRQFPQKKKKKGMRQCLSRCTLLAITW